MAKLTTENRNALAERVFALPGRRFPIPDKVHARVAKSYAAKGFNAGTLTASQKAKVDRKANAKLGKG